VTSVHITLNHYPEGKRGVEVYVHELLQELSKHNRVVLFTRSASIDAPNVEFNGAYHLFKIPKRAGRRETRKYFVQCVRDFKPDIINIHQFPGLGQANFSTLLKINIPCVVSFHEYSLFCQRVWLMKDERTACSFEREDCTQCKYPKNFVRRWFYRQKVRQRRRDLLEVTNNASALISPSLSMKPNLEGFGVKNEDFNVLRLGIRLGKFRRRRVPLRRGDDITIGFIGSIAFHKGIAVLLQAMHFAGIPNQLLLYGKIRQAEARDIEALIRKTPWVVLRGEFDNADVMKILEEIDILVAPSIWEEPFCLVVEEARAAGVPVITTAIGAMPERIIDRRNGFLLAPGNAEMLADKLRWLIANYDSVVATLDVTHNLSTIEENAAFYEQVYAKIMEHRVHLRQ
jgi:glycosyltransferase involved in cell wall biosynthesis